eukprot:SAG31_NODE_29454_length_395_cov_0.702703_2_plen_65_part_01
MLRDLNEAGHSEVIPRWAKFHSKYGKYTIIDSHIRSTTVALNVIRKILLLSMHRCYGIRMAALSM